ncbi:MAG: hydantoinase/oxoprolinase family protein [Pseudomonadota bacterium]
MAILLGIDTGGTYTDAALVRDGAPAHKAVLTKAKSLTTRHNLALGIRGAVDAVLDAPLEGATPVKPSEIGLVSISTTLATNALVEGQGSPIAFVSIGFSPKDLTKAGLDEALGAAPVVAISGGHGPHGQEQTPLDLAPLEACIDALKGQVSGFAVAGYFAVRNPAHEVAVRAFLVEHTGLPVTCSHTLSARLNGPKRALTTVLNARLIPMITGLISATQSYLAQRTITAPLMVVRGDGALVSAAFAAERPIETILSGPAASLVGATFLTGEQNAFVNDIGGTTSDVAVLVSGRPRLEPDGAMVGGFRTMVEAVAMHTYGLGGDSQISLGGSALQPIIELGPSRVVPVSLLAVDHTKRVHAVLDRQLASTLNGRYDGQFARATRIARADQLADGLGHRESALYAKLQGSVESQVEAVPVPLDRLLDTATDRSTLRRLVQAGLVQISAVTPSDAARVFGRGPDWDTDAATKALRLFARQRDGGGQPLATSAEELATRILKRVERRSAEVVLQTAFTLDNQDGASLITHPLVQQSLDQNLAESSNAPGRQGPQDPQGPQGPQSFVKTKTYLDRPLIGLGASAALYHPQAAKGCGVEAIIPDHADVANAVGAVAGNIRMQAQRVITQPAEGRFHVTGIDTPFLDEETATQAAEKAAKEDAFHLAKNAGAGDIAVTVTHDFKRAEVENHTMLIEAHVTAEATGRPPIV